MKITDEKLAALRSKYPRGVVVLSAEHADPPPKKNHDDPDPEPQQFAFRKVTREIYAEYRASTKQAAATGGGTGEEETAIARKLVDPDQLAEFDQLRESAPHITATFGNELLSDASAGLVVVRDPR